MREAFERFAPSGKIINCDKVCEMDAQLFMIIVMIALECGVLNWSAYSLNLALNPWVVGSGQPMLNPVRVTDHVKMVLSRLRSGLSTHLGSLSFEGQGAFAT